MCLMVLVLVLPSEKGFEVIMKIMKRFDACDVG